MISNVSFALFCGHNWQCLKATSKVAPRGTQGTMRCPRLNPGFQHAKFMLQPMNVAPQFKVYWF